MLPVPMGMLAARQSGSALPPRKILSTSTTGVTCIGCDWFQVMHALVFKQASHIQQPLCLAAASLAFEHLPTYPSLHTILYLHFS